VLSLKRAVICKEKEVIGFQGYSDVTYGNPFIQTQKQHKEEENP